MRNLLALSLLLATLAGCGIAPSIHPLSDEETTVLDGRLIGRWYALDKEGKAGQGRRPDLLYVGRRDGAENELEAVFVEMEVDRAKVTRLRLRATKIGDHHYVSATSADLKTEEATPRPVWILARYELKASGVLEVRLLDPAFAARAILAGKLEGKVEVAEGTEEDPEVESVLIEAPTRELREWVAANAAGAFAAEEVGRLRRAEAPDDQDEPEDDE